MFFTKVPSEEVHVNWKGRVLVCMVVLGRIERPGFLQLPLQSPPLLVGVPILTTHSHTGFLLRCSQDLTTEKAFPPSNSERLLQKRKETLQLLDMVLWVLNQKLYDSVLYAFIFFVQDFFIAEIMTEIKHGETICLALIGYFIQKHGLIPCCYCSYEDFFYFSKFKFQTLKKNLKNSWFSKKSL